MELRLRSHELESKLGAMGLPLRAFAGGASRADQDKGDSGVVGSDMLASMAGLKSRQQQYIDV